MVIWLACLIRWRERLELLSTGVDGDHFPRSIYLIYFMLRFHGDHNLLLVISIVITLVTLALVSL